jgi:hypothetical protein
MRPPRVVALVGSSVLMLGSLLLGGGPAQAFVTPPSGPIVSPPPPVATGSELIAAEGGSAIEGAELAALSGVEAAVPAFAAAPPVAVAIFGFTGGLVIGQGAARAVGFSDNEVCSLQNGVLTAIAGALDSVNCTSFNNALTNAQQNVDQALASATGAKVCQATDSLWCIQLVGVGTPSVLAFTDSTFGVEYCFSVTGPHGSVTASSGQWHYYLSDGTGGETNLSPNNPATSCASGLTVDVLGRHSTAPLPIVKYGCSTNVGQTCGTTTAPVASAPANPTRQIECDLTGSNGTVYVATTGTFKETDTGIPPPVCPALPAGVPPTHEKLILLTTGSSVRTTIYDGAVTGAYGSAATAYPDCAFGACTMQLYSLDPTVKPCAVGGPCAQWFQDGSKSSDFECVYGPTTNPTEYALTLSQCNVLSNFYDPAKVGEGDAFTDPNTGLDTGVKTSPDLDHAISNEPGPSTEPDGSNSDCFPQGWSALNPLQWVLQPVQCAFRWAFIPAATVIPTAEADLQADATDSPPGKIDAFVATIAWPAAPTGCSGVDFDLSGWKSIPVGGALFGSWSGHVQLLDACPGQPLAPWATWVSLVLGLFFVGAGIVALSRLAGKTFGFTGIDGE